MCFEKEDQDGLSPYDNEAEEIGFNNALRTCEEEFLLFVFVAAMMTLKPERGYIPKVLHPTPFPNSSKSRSTHNSIRRENLDASRI